MTVGALFARGLALVERFKREGKPAHAAAVGRSLANALDEIGESMAYSHTGAPRLHTHQRHEEQHT